MGSLLWAVRASPVRALRRATGRTGGCDVYPPQWRIVPDSSNVLAALLLPGKGPGGPRCHLQGASSHGGDVYQCANFLKV